MKSILYWVLLSFPVFVYAEHNSSTTSTRPAAARDFFINPNEAIDSNRVQNIKSQLCSKDFNKTAWENALPRIDGEFTKTNAVLYLLQFQKKGGFNTSEHLSILKAILRDAEFTKENLLLVDQALESIQASDPNLYKAMLQDYSRLFNFEHRQLRAENPQPQCRSHTENDFFKSEAEKKLSEIMKQVETLELANKHPDLSTWHPLFPLRTSLNQLTPNQKNEALHGMVVASTHGLSSVPDLVGLFDSKVAKYSLQPVAPIFGIKPKDLTDLDAESNRGYVRVRALGNHPLTPGQKENKFGFFSQDLDTFSGRTSGKVEKKYAWIQNGKTYRGTVSATASSVDNSRKDEKGLPYDELTKDGKLSGIVIVGSNQDDEGEPIINQYKAFYEGHGYSFAPAESTSDMYQEFKQAILSGKADYFVKEAHSDGEPLYLFEIATHGKILKGAKTVNGKTEEIMLAFPNQGSSNMILSNQEFGSWIKSRDKDGMSPLVYFNVSCWSAKNKAPNELAAAGSKNLIEIPAITETDPLENKSNNALYQLMEGFLEKKNYSEMRDKMKNDPYYVNRTWDWYILPDERAYSDYVWNRLTTPIDIQVNMTDPSGNAFRFGN